MYALSIFSPLLGFLVARLLGGRLPGLSSGWITSGFMLFSAVESWILFKDVALEGNFLVVPLLDWISVGSLKVFWSLRFDSLSVVMMCVVTTVSTLVHFYSIGYMAHDKAFSQFMAYLSLFTFLMLMLVTADNLVQLFLGWEGVGLASYLLIGFWHHKPSANQAAMKAFVVNRVGDLGFVLGISTLYAVFHSLQLDQIFAQIPQVSDLTYTIAGREWPVLTIAAFLLFVGAMGKSAQLGLHVWLPDAMEGPTPVSALIHAATMVTAGVFLVARFSPLFEQAPSVLNLIAIVGGTTAFFAATIGLVQNDVKRIIAYSTCSQLGYMFFAAGVSAYDASIFHLFTHAFFKALLFLGAGSIIHAMSEEQDIQKMGGVAKLIPQTYVLMWIGSLALVGMPGLSGAYSKDLILEKAWEAGTFPGVYAFILGVITVFLTAFYSGRLLFLVFHGTSHAEERVQAHVHESPLTMIFPMGVLAVGAVLSGVLFKGWMTKEGFWGHSLFFLRDQEGPLSLPLWVERAPLLAGFLGLGASAVLYLKYPLLPTYFRDALPKVYTFLLKRWYVDELYEKTIGIPLQKISQFLGFVMDPRVLDDGGPNFMVSLLGKLSKIFNGIQKGSLYYDMMIMILGILVIGCLCLCQSLCQGIL